MLVDFVIPLYNEQESLVRFHTLLDQAELPSEYTRRYIYVNDGSTDQTPALLDRIAASDPRMMVIHLSRNFGHQAALSAGLDRATADIVFSKGVSDSATCTAPTTSLPPV